VVVEYDRGREDSAAADSVCSGHFGDADASERRRHARKRLAALSDREREVAVAVGSGASNAEVAASLFMSEATVKAHVSRLFPKLDVANRVQIAIVVHDADQP
jgi:DNA-binding NarL/FixJ family response regulator